MDQIAVKLSESLPFLDQLKQESGMRENLTLEKDSDSLLFSGELKLLKGKFSEGITLFEQASQSDPSNPFLFYRQGLALFEYGSEEAKSKALFFATKKFKKALQLFPDFIEAKHALANALVEIGKIFEEQHYFIEAQEKYLQVIKLTEKEKNYPLSDLHWDFGVVWLHIFDYSEEAVDLQYALQNFEKATEYGQSFPCDFWIDYGRTCMKLAQVIGDVRLYVKAIHYFKHAISQSDPSFESWNLLANSLASLYSLTHDEDHFSQANDCFAATANLRPNNSAVWFEWALFLAQSARRNKDLKRIRSAIEKCHHAYVRDQNNPQIIALWGASLALLGELTDRLDLINEGHNKISDALDLTEDDPEIWYFYGLCLNSFGHYFTDFDYFYQAIEKFQVGLSIDRTHYTLWHALATTYTAVGILESDPEALEKSLKFYKKAINFYPSSYFIFDYAFSLSKVGELCQNQDFLEEAVKKFEQTLSLQKNAIYLHPDWLFSYACTLDMLGDFYEDETYYSRAIEIFSHVLMIDPDFPQIHYCLSQSFCHLGELNGEAEFFYRSLHHLRLAHKHQGDDEQIALEWGIILMNIAEHCHDSSEMEQTYREAEQKLIHAAKLGNLQAYYYLGCLYSILKQYEKAMSFILKADAFKSLPLLDEILQDDWLDGLRSTVDFHQFLSHLENRSQMREEK
ncbi:MAG: hypothetical protein L0207_03275 [Chlamydiae bacterium]|nr:hypothetical protein [Chlamydiota bacterium]